MSTTTWNSDLLSKGSILRITSLNNTSEIAKPIAISIHRNSCLRLGRPCSPLRYGVSLASNQRANRSSFWLGPLTWWLPNNLSVSQGVTMKAIASEISMPMLALIGIGLIYGPIKPLTKAIGNSAAITVSVARMVGPPTSSTALGITSSKGWLGSSKRRR